MKEKIKRIGEVATIRLNGLTVEVKISDYKNSYGRDRWEVSPVAGNGKAWVENLEFKD